MPLKCINGGRSNAVTNQQQPPGEVVLVGAGPGDPDLLTIKALKALQHAEVVLFDDLVSPEILQLVASTAHCISVGKRGGRKSCRQRDINSLMKHLALSGRRVLRLKCGDPSIFGRAGEELDELRSAGIKTTVIPGITAAVAMAAQLQITLTHRAHAQSVRLVTGHARNGELPDNLDWASMARNDSTTIYYMGGRTASLIATKLMQAGALTTTPCVICASVSRPEEEHWQGPLNQLANGIRQIGHNGPVLIGVGAVFAAAQPLAALLEPTQAAQTDEPSPDSPQDHLPRYKFG
ncbi:MAG: uroporphyrinogen-III C-methyltransferase [Burkholderiaceae bacterium]